MDEIKNRLQRMVTDDQEQRGKSPIDWNMIAKIDAQNTAELKQIIENHGWPTFSKFGEDAAHNAWLLVQHADKDPEFQQYCLSLMNELSDTEVSKKDVAYLTDRVFMKTVGVQKYGTQYIMMPTYILVQPVEDLENLDKIRAEVGMKSMKEYLAREDMKAYFSVRQPVL